MYIGIRAFNHADIMKFYMIYLLYLINLMSQLVPTLVTQFISIFDNHMIEHYYIVIRLFKNVSNKNLNT